MATPNIACMLQSSIGHAGEVAVSRSAYYAPGARASSADAVLFRLGPDLFVGEALFFGRVGDVDYACIQRWLPMGKNQFNRNGFEPVVCRL